MIRKRNGILAGAAVILAAGLGTGAAVAATGGGAGTAAQPRPAAGAATGPGTPAGPGYSWYRSAMGGFSGGGMMGGGSVPGWMMSRSGYQWMTGGAGAPGWMTGGNLPGAMMGSGGDPGTVMGRLFADAPGPRMSPARAQRLGSAAPAGAVISRAARTVTFTGKDVRLVVLASPSMPAESFRIAGMTNPVVVVPAGARVTITVVNADDDMAHGLVVTRAGAAGSPMPMMTAAPAFRGAAVWFLGERTAAGMHEGTLAFTATTRGSYQYLCPVPGHAREGMAGSFTVR